MHEISVDKKGTHSIQAVLDTCLTNEEEDFIAQELCGHVVDLASVTNVELMFSKLILSHSPIAIE